MQPKVIEITNRIIERSQDNRQRYLERIKQASQSRRARTTLPCGNLAHGFAACSSSNKSDLTGGEKANVAIVPAYNDMLSAHQPYQIIQNALKRPSKRTAALPSLPVGCTGHIRQQQP
jgi:phosphogluconate dehydratase